MSHFSVSFRLNKVPRSLSFLEMWQEKNRYKNIMIFKDTRVKRETPMNTSTFTWVHVYICSNKFPLWSYPGSKNVLLFCFKYWMQIILNICNNAWGIYVYMYPCAHNAKKSEKHKWHVNEKFEWKTLKSSRNTNLSKHIEAQVAFAVVGERKTGKTNYISAMHISKECINIWSHVNIYVCMDV